MPITYLPRIPALGIMAPVLGPWFSNAATNLPVPVNGSLRVNFTPNCDWLPPAAGNLSVYVTGGAPPSALNTLRDHHGNWPFPLQPGGILAYFRLLPEVEARLHALVGLIPAATSLPIAAPPAAATVPTRPQVRSLVMYIPPAAAPLNANAIGNLFGGLNNLPGNTVQEQMASVGLTCDNAGNNIGNSQVPMTHLRRPGGQGNTQDRLLFNVNTAVDLWAFDRRGRPIDPGAVASWWSWLLNTGVGDDPGTGAADFQLLAPNIQAANYPQSAAPALPQVANFAAQLIAHLVDPHEGVLGAPFLGLAPGAPAGGTIRLRNNGTAFTAGNNNNLLIVGAGGAALDFSNPPVVPANTPVDNPPVDNAPRPRMAVLPNGSYLPAVTLWPGGPVATGITRDFVRVGVVDEESFLVGVTRQDSRNPTQGSDSQRRRDAAQNRPSTRINVNRTANAAGVLLANSQLAANALLALPNAATPTRLVLGVADTAWGGTPLTALPAAPTGVVPILPATLSEAALVNGAQVPIGAVPAGQYCVRGLGGGGTAAENFQTVLVEISFGPNPDLAGVMIRAWPQGFDPATGHHFRMTGGAARIDPITGFAYLTMVLANGSMDPVGLLGMDIQVVVPDATGGVAAQRRYADCRFDRPAVIPGNAFANATALGGSTWVICETGVTGAGPLPTGSVPPGAHVVLLTSPPALIDRTTITAGAAGTPAAMYDANTLVSVLTANAAANTFVSLTEPAFDSALDRADAAGRPLPNAPGGPGMAGGGPGGGLPGLLGGRLHLLNRVPAGDGASSVPYPLLDRLEVGGATTAAAAAAAVIGSGPPTAWTLEPTANHFMGYPGLPASIETHGTGIALTGAPAVAVAEYVQERTAGLGFAQVQGLAEPWRSIVIQSELAVAAEAAATALPAIADPATTGPVAAVLRTCALGMEGLPGAATAFLGGQSPKFPTSEKLEQGLYDWLNANIVLPPGLPGGIGGPFGNTLQGTPAGPVLASITRALDRRILTAGYGARETLTALLAAIDRAQDLIYIETPALDMLPIDPTGENIVLWTRLINRMNAIPGLCVALCVSTLPAPGTPEAYRKVRDHCLMDAVDAMRAIAPDRFVLFSPGVGAGRALRLASTSVVIDDAFALTGTTHLSRRGLSWDSSLAAAVFDENLVDGRPADVSAFRIQLMADRLGINPNLVPADAMELVKAIRDLDSRGSNRLSATPIVRPDEAPGNGTIDAWIPDGSVSDLNLAALQQLFNQASFPTDVAHAMVEG